MPYQPPSGWVESIAELERENVFHEDAGCTQIHEVARLQAVERPGRCRQCTRCVRHTANALLDTSGAA